MQCFISGISGKMGKTLLSSHLPDIEICGGMDRQNIYDSSLSPTNVLPAFDVIIDFSHKTALPKVLEIAQTVRKPLVIATTGFDDEDIEKIKRAATNIPILQISNTSYGIFVVKEILKTISPLLLEWDCVICEKHHKNKKDCPSGTALSLKENIRQKDNNRISINSIRGGTICGEHEIIFLGDDEEIKITHIAYSRKIFAVGAIMAAKKLIKMPHGYYTEL